MRQNEQDHVNQNLSSSSMDLTRNPRCTKKQRCLGTDGEEYLPKMCSGYPSIGFIESLSPKNDKPSPESMNSFKANFNFTGVKDLNDDA
eukprot:CAMPEP_0198141582 /NCGR_PEP_ID=MMETSP1443-20131203/4569_1 /TAXON_ID=186043 /ORGANISM="Entomoneis sp., Strain CCMP2396" /LENGTH=88 /DNA_ID=CAMNT_0043804377 /DNA_START=22 /DNA_END=284 /DNA_ORIENTATION=-